MTAAPQLKMKLESKLPSCTEIGLQASKKGDFQMARQMLRKAIEQLEGLHDKQSQLIDLTTNIADTYLNEGRYDSAKEWYAKALHRAETLHGAHSLQGACLLARLAEVSVLQSDMTDFQKSFDSAQRAYLLADESSDVSNLLAALIDLSWALCVRGQFIEEVRHVNCLIAQIRQIDEEDRLAA
jgi:tetratricopeptide (TPR) repeat protein